MKCIDLRIEDDLYAALEREGFREGVSKSALVRRYLRERLKPLPPLEEDPLWELIGIAGDAEPVDDIDEVIYGGHERDRP